MNAPAPYHKEYMRHPEEDSAAIELVGNDDIDRKRDNTSRDNPGSSRSFQSSSSSRPSGSSSGYGGSRTGGSSRPGGSGSGSGYGGGSGSGYGRPPSPHEGRDMRNPTD